MTYNVFGGTLNLAQSINDAAVYRGCMNQRMLRNTLCKSFTKSHILKKVNFPEYKIISYQLL